jgi:hypothetical protein
MTCEKDGYDGTWSGVGDILYIVGHGLVGDMGMVGQNELVESGKVGQGLVGEWAW